MLKYRSYTSRDTQENITPKGCPYLGAALGSKEFVTEMVASNIENWEKELGILSEIAITQSHSFIHDFPHKFSYLLRCNPRISQQFKPDMIGSWISEVCNDVCIENRWRPLTVPHP